VLGGAVLAAAFVANPRMSEPVRRYRQCLGQRHLTGRLDRGYFWGVKRRFRAAVVAPALALALFGAKPALSTEPIPNRDQLLTQIAALEKPDGQTSLIKQPLDAAKNALNRARDARSAGDLEHGIELEALAFDYVTIAKDMLHAAALEAGLRKAQAEFTKSETARRQTETLIEVTVAQRERTKAQLAQIRTERDAKKPEAKVKTESRKNAKGAKK